MNEFKKFAGNCRWSEKRYLSIFEVDLSLKSALKLLKAFGVSSSLSRCFIRMVKPVRREDHKCYGKCMSKGQNWSANCDLIFSTRSIFSRIGV